MRVFAVATIIAVSATLIAAAPIQGKSHGPKYYKPLTGTISANYTFETAFEDESEHFEQRVSITWQGQPADKPLVPEPYDMWIGYPAHGPTALVTVDVYSYRFDPSPGECDYGSAEIRAHAQAMAYLEVQFPPSRPGDRMKMPKGRKMAPYWFRDVTLYVTIATQIPTTITSVFDEMTAGGCVRKTEVRNRGEEFKPTRSTSQEIEAEFRGTRSRNSRTALLNARGADVHGSVVLDWGDSLSATGGGSITFSRNPRLRW